MNEPLHTLGSGAGDWPEDFGHDNGFYLVGCRTCERRFFGHKRRIMCKDCALSIAVHGDEPVTEA